MATTVAPPHIAVSAADTTALTVISSITSNAVSNNVSSQKRLDFVVPNSS